MNGAYTNIPGAHISCDMMQVKYRWRPLSNSHTNTTQTSVITVEIHTNERIFTQNKAPSPSTTWNITNLHPTCLSTHPTSRSSHSRHTRHSLLTHTVPATTGRTLPGAAASPDVVRGSWRPPSMPPMQAPCGSLLRSLARLFHRRRPPPLACTSHKHHSNISHHSGNTYK